MCPLTLSIFYCEQVLQEERTSVNCGTKPLEERSGVTFRRLAKGARVDLEEECPYLALSCSDPQGTPQEETPVLCAETGKLSP